jgi:hypothetical protein
MESSAPPHSAQLRQLLRSTDLEFLFRRLLFGTRATTVNFTAELLEAVMSTALVVGCNE